MTSIQNKEAVEILIPQWNEQSIEARNELAALVQPWVRSFAETEVTKQHRLIEASNKKVNTPVSYWEPEEITQEVLTKFMEKFEQLELTDWLSTYQMLRLMTHRMLVDKIKYLVKGDYERKPISSFDSVDDVIEPMGQIDDAIDEMDILVETLDALSQKYHEQVLCYILHHIDGQSHENISLMVGGSTRKIQRHIKLVGAALQAELTKRLQGVVR